MKFYAARYMWTPQTYEVVLYTSREAADETPHDYPYSFSSKDWKGLGCRLPRKDEVMAVELLARQLPEPKAGKKGKGR